MHALEDLLTSLLRRNMTPQGLQIMVEVCSGCALPWGWGHGVGGTSPSSWSLAYFSWLSLPRGHWGFWCSLQVCAGGGVCELGGSAPSFLGRCADGLSPDGSLYSPLLHCMALGWREPAGTPGVSS